MITLGGKKCLFYRGFSIHVGIIGATTEALAIAMAVHNSGGIVIAQVERVADCGSLNPRQAKVPGVLFDCERLPAHEARRIA